MPFTGALDSVLEQHRSAREGILEANMNPAATVKALRAESAPANTKNTRQPPDVRYCDLLGCYLSANRTWPADGS
jgi:hypothetical protein